jgi:hypothetical protein
VECLASTGYTNVLEPCAADNAAIASLAKLDVL